MTKKAAFVFFTHFSTDKQRLLANKMRELSTEIHRIKTQGEGKALALAQEELAETRDVKNKLTQDLEKAKKVSGREYLS